MTKRLAALAVCMMLITGCDKMQPIDFKGSEPRLVLEDYFQGEVWASGLFEDRFGNLRRQFRVEITGTWNGQSLQLDERFLYDDGEEETRIWTIEKIDDHNYVGRADNVIGTAEGTVYGNALNWQYDIDLKVGERTLRVHFNDWLYLQDGGVLLNRARVTKWGIEIGTVTLVFVKPAAQSVNAGRITGVTTLPPVAVRQR